MDELQLNRIREIRGQILLELYAAFPIKLSIEGLHRRLRRAQYNFSPDEIERQALFLCGQGLAEDLVDETTGTQRYGITSKGTLAHENSR